MQFLSVWFPSQTIHISPNKLLEIMTIWNKETV